MSDVYMPRQRDIYITMYDARPGSVKAFFIVEQRNIFTWLYVPLTEHTKTHLTYFREKQKCEERTTRYGSRRRCLNP